MPYDRGQWRHSAFGGSPPGMGGSGGHVTPTNGGGRLDYKFCPLCGRSQKNPRNTCLSCTYNFKKRNIGLEEAFKTFKTENEKIPLPKFQNVLKNNYSLTTRYIKSSKEIPNVYSNIFDSNKNKILFVSNSDEVITNLHEVLLNGINCFVTRLSSKSVGLKSLIDYIGEFQKVNNHLSKYSLKIFDNVESAKDIFYLKYLSQEIHYINEKDAHVLNDFIKLYWKYWYDSQETAEDPELEKFDLDEEISKQTDDLIKVKSALNWFINQIGKLTEILESFGIFNEDVNEKIILMDKINLFENEPHIIDVKEQENFINDLKEYQRLNKDKIDIFNKINDFIENQNDALKFLDIFQNIINQKNQYNQNISDLKEYLRSIGINCDNLNVYYDLKNKFSKSKSYIYFDNEEYYLLNEKLKKYISDYDVSFNIHINNNLKTLYSSISDLADKNNANLINSNDFAEKIKKLKDILNKTQIYCESLFEIEDNGILEVLDKKPNLISPEEYLVILELLDDFNEDNSVSLGEYIDNSFNDLNDLITNLLSYFNDAFYKNFEIEFIEYNLKIVKELVEKMGISISSIREINNDLLETFDFSNYSNIEDKKHFFDENYLNNNSQSEVLNDFNLLNISVKSLLFEFDNADEYEYLDDLNKDIEVTVDDKSIVLKDKLEELINLSSFEDLMNNYSSIFEYAFDLIQGLNLRPQFENNLLKLKKNFDFAHEIYINSNSFDFGEILNNTQSYLPILKEQYLIDLKFVQLYEKEIFTQETLNLIDENDLKELKSLINYIKHNYSEKEYYSTFDEIIEKDHSITMESKINSRYYSEIMSKIKNTDSNNFYNLYSELKNYPELNINFALDDFKLVHDIIVLDSNLNISSHGNILYLTYDVLKSFSEYLSDCKEFSEYVDLDIVDLNIFNNFDNKIMNVDLKINSIKKVLNNFTHDEEVMNSFSHFSDEKIIDIEKKVSEINKTMEIKTDNVNEIIENQQSIVDNLYSLCINYPFELDHKYHYFKRYFLKLKQDLQEYNDLLNLENNILSHDYLIENNLKNQWEGLFTDVGKIKSKFNIDIEFNELYYNGILTQKEVNKNEPLSQDEREFINSFKKRLSNEELKSIYLLLYDNQEELLSEINKLQNYSKDDLVEFKDSLIRLNNILNVEKIDGRITLFEYHIGKNNSNSGSDEYLDELKSFSGIYYKYFDGKDFNLSMDEILNKINIHFKYTEFINNDIIKKDNLQQIRDNFNDFSKGIEELDNLRKKICYIIDQSKNIYFADNTARFDYSTKFDDIKSFKDNYKNSHVFLADMDYVRENLEKGHIDHYDYVICDDELTFEDKIHLFLISKHKLILVGLVE